MLNQPAITTALIEEWTAIDSLLAGLSDEQWHAPTALPGWDVHDVVAHIVGTEKFLAGQLPPELDVSGFEHIRNSIGEMNEKYVQSLRPLSNAELLAEYRATIADRTAFLSALSPAQWDEISPFTPVGPASYGRFMRIRLFDCWMHEIDIRDAVGVAGDEGSARGDLAMAEVETNLGRMIGKLGQAPTGSLVTLSLTGPLARTRHVAVTDRARVVTTLDGPATVTITLDSRLFARLAGGRTTAAAHPGQIGFIGDKQLGAQLVDKFAFTI